MQPAAAGDRSGMVVNNKGARTGEDGFVNSEKFWRKKIEDVPVDQVRCGNRKLEELIGNSVVLP